MAGVFSCTFVIYHRPRHIFDHHRRRIPRKRTELADILAHRSWGSYKKRGQKILCIFPQDSLERHGCHVDQLGCQQNNKTELPAARAKDTYVDILTGLSWKIRLSWRRLTPDSQERNARGDGVRWMVEGEPDSHRFGLFGFLYSVRNGKMHIACGCRCGGATGVEPQKIFLTPVVQACALLLLISCNLAIIS